MLTILCASLLFLCGSFASPSGQLATSRKLYLSVITQDYVSVVYVNQSGSGIQLVVKPSGFTVKDMEGRTILNIEDQFYQVNAMTYRLIEVKGESFLQEVGIKKGSEIYLSLEDVKLFKASFYSSNVAQCDQIISQARYKRSSDVHIEKLHLSVKDFLEDPYMQLLLDIARALGKDSITGYDYPVMLQFYMTVLRIRALLDNPTVQHSSATENDQDHGKCLDDCPPCKESGCHGMCGRECECWSWVCGDCCYQQGCYDLGHCCQENPYSFVCLFPWNFSCDSYEC